MHFRTFDFRNAEIILNASHRLRKEIEEVLTKLELAPPGRNGCAVPSPHLQIQRAFVRRGWEPEALVSPRTGKRHYFDLFKERVAIEIELTNRELLYRDYLRFQMAETEGRLDVGVIVLLDKQARWSWPSGKSNLLPRVEDVADDLACLRGALSAPVWVVSLY
jgi:hypothetical protein